MSKYPYYKVEDIKSGSFSYSYQLQNFQFKHHHHPIKFQDLSESEQEDCESLDREDTIRYYNSITGSNSMGRSPTPPTSPISMATKHEMDNEFIKNVTNIEIEKDQAGTDDKAIGYSILFTILIFIFVHLFPFTNNVVLLLNANMGPFLSKTSILFLSGYCGHKTSVDRSYYKEIFKRIQNRRAYQPGKSLLILLVGLYTSTFTTDWVFRLMFSILSIPWVGPGLVVLSFSWIMVSLGLFCFMVLGNFSWTFVGSFFNKPSTKCR